MSAPSAPRHVARKRRRFWHRPWFWVLVGAVVVVGALGSWIGVRGLEARAQLEAAQSLIPELKAQAAAFDVEGATLTLARVSTSTDRAIELTSDPVWRAVEFVPLLGKNLTVVRELSVATGSVLDTVVSPLLDVADKINPAAITPKNGAIDVQPFIDAIPLVSTANEGAQAAVAAVAAIDTTGTLPQLEDAKTKVATLLGEIALTLDQTSAILPLIPPALGSEGVRSYVVMFQNNAELRALGGTALSFALVTVDQGNISLVKTVPAGLDNFASYGSSVIPVPDGADAVYPNGVFGTFIANVTARPSFVTAAEMTQEMWTRQFGAPVDAVISVDPVALKYVLSATDPIGLSSGDSLTPDTIVPLLLNEVYQRYNTGNVTADNEAQDALYSEAVGATFSRLTNGPLDPGKLMAALTQGLRERRISFWSARPGEQETLVANDLANGLPVSDDNVERVGVYLQDYVGSKLNFYLEQTVQTSHGVCRADGLPTYRVTVGLRSYAPSNAADSLSRFILGGWEREGVAPGTQRLIVMLYAPPGATISGASVDGAPVVLDALHDDVYAVGKLVVSVDPGATVHVSYDVTGAAPGRKEFELTTTPTVGATVVTEAPLDCATVPAA